MKLRTRLTMSFGGILLILILLAGTSIVNLMEISDEVNSIDNMWTPSIVSVMTLNIELNRIRAAVSGSLAEKDQEMVRFYENRIAESASVVAKNLALFKEISSKRSTSEELDYLAQIDKTGPALAALRDRLFPLIKEGQYEKAISLFNSEYRPLYNKTRDAYAGLVKISLAQAKQATKAADAFGDNAVLMAIILTVAGIIISIVLSWLLVLSVNKQLGKDPGELNGITHRVVNGDYNVDDGSPKVGVYGAIIQMVLTLKENIENAHRESKNAKEQSQKAHEAMERAEAASRDAQAKASAMHAATDKLEELGSALSSASTELSAQIEQSDRNSAEASQRLSEAATAMNEMNSTVQEVARNASSASSASSETREKAEAGAQVVEKAVRSIEHVHHQMSRELKDDMTQLNEHARSIDQIMGVISDIADQTNLLALNAAIEAARAGEAGRGFAVVADEVRKLAEKTMASTHDVGNAIKSIQESTARSTASVDNAVARIEEATQFANESGRALKEIVGTAEVTADQVNAIATASEEQSAASEEIDHSILECNDMGKLIADAMAQAAKAVSNLTVQAQELTELIHKMKNV